MDVSAFKVIVGGVPLASVIWSAVERSQKAVTEAEESESGSGVEGLAAEARRQRIVMEFQAHTARVAQEIAIAERMATADVVEIEEFYEGVGKGNVGVQVEGASAVVGLGGEGRKVTKRVIKISGTVVTPNS